LLRVVDHSQVQGLHSLSSDRSSLSDLHVMDPRRQDAAALPDLSIFLITEFLQYLAKPTLLLD
jgi:hypothetical protein